MELFDETVSSYKSKLEQKNIEEWFTNNLYPPLRTRGVFTCMICGDKTHVLTLDWQTKHLDNPFHELIWLLKRKIGL